MDMPKVLALIPARGGSKRLPRKNIMPIAGKPLIAYTIQAVKESTMVTDWLVSSEDDEIIKVAKSYGAPVPFKRPLNLADDDVRNIDVLVHATQFMEQEQDYHYDVLVLLQPTSPIRSSQHIDEAIIKLWNSDLPSLASIKGPYQKRDPALKKIDANGVLIDYCGNTSNNPKEAFFIYNAALYAVKRDYFVKYRKIVCDKQIPFLMDKFHSVDVDDKADFLVAQAYLDYLNSKEKDKL
jgi:CMP-N,N'-diacetyllegionaminic acid synthase